MARKPDIQYPPEASLRAELQALAVAYGGAPVPGAYSVAYTEVRRLSRDDDRRQTLVIETTTGKGPFVACGGWSIPTKALAASSAATSFRPVSVVVRKAGGAAITLPDVHVPGFSVEPPLNPLQSGGAYDTVVFPQMCPSVVNGGAVWPCRTSPGAAAVGGGLGGFPWPAPIFLGDGETLVVEVDRDVIVVSDNLLIRRQWGISGFHVDAETWKRLQAAVGELRVFAASWRPSSPPIVATNMLPCDLVVHDVAVAQIRPGTPFSASANVFAQDGGIRGIDTWRVGPFFSDDASSHVGPLNLPALTQIVVDPVRDPGQPANDFPVVTHLVCSTR